MEPTWKCNKCGKENKENRKDCFNCSVLRGENEVQTANIDKSDSPTPNPIISPFVERKSEIDYTEPNIPSYLSFLRIIAGINLAIGIIALIAFGINLLGSVNHNSFEPTSYTWVIALSIALEGFLAYGLLNAVADIAENMIVVGNYVRNLKKDISK